MLTDILFTDRAAPRRRRETPACGGLLRGFADHGPRAKHPAAIHHLGQYSQELTRRALASLESDLVLFNCLCILNDQWTGLPLKTFAALRNRHIQI
jgi:hypothetical protein